MLSDPPCAAALASAAPCRKVIVERRSVHGAAAGTTTGRALGWRLVRVFHPTTAPPDRGQPEDPFAPAAGLVRPLDGLADL
jgi:hypothetical protein